MKRALLFTLLVIITISTFSFHSGNCRVIKNDSSVEASDHDDDDGMIMMIKGSDMIGAKTVTCEPMYGFLPCSTTLLGLLFMIVVYEVLLSFGGKYTTAGTDLFFGTFGTGVVSSGVFHLFGTIPQVGLILVSGLSSSSDDVEELLGMSMGLLVGQTIMSLTLIWGLVIAFGSRDLSQPQETSPSSSSQILVDSDDQPSARPVSLSGYGVTTDVETSHTARIMLISLIPFLILAFAKLFNSTSTLRMITLVALIVTVILLLSYLIYQGFQPWIQNRRLEFVLRKYINRNLLQNLLTTGRRPNVPAIRELFRRIDTDNNSYISISELKALVLGLQVETGLHDHDFVSRIMEQFDTTGDTNISEEEFVKALSNWLIAAKDSSANSILVKKQKLFTNTEKKTSATAELQSLISREEENIAQNYEVWLNYTKAGLLLILGTAITAILAQPLMESIVSFSSDANIPSFLISYVVIPAALSFRQAISAVNSAKQKTVKDLSLTLSEIYNGIFMNNLVSMVVYLGLAYIKNLSTDVSAEVLAVLIICLYKGLYTSFHTTFKYWTCIAAFTLYPVSLLIMYFLTEYLGWS